MEITTKYTYNTNSSGFPELREDSLRKTSTIPNENQQQDKFNKPEDRFTPSSNTNSDIYSFGKLTKSQSDNKVDISIGVEPSDKESDDSNIPKPKIVSEKKTEVNSANGKSESEGNEGTNETRGTEELSDEEKAQVEELKKIDQAVRAHEAAHLAAGAGLVSGGASFSYTSGPDGKRYAVGGEVSIDTSEESDPRATIRKMDQVRSAALAPVDPSAQDRAVAAAASQMAARAQMELLKEQTEKLKESTSSDYEYSKPEFVSNLEKKQEESIDIPANKTKADDNENIEKKSIISDKSSEKTTSSNNLAGKRESSSENEFSKRVSAYNKIAVAAYSNADRNFGHSSGSVVNAYVY